MDEQNIVLNLKGQHAAPGSEPQQNELFTEGRLLQDETGRCVLEFNEALFTGATDSMTRLTVDEDSLWLHRSGFVESNFRFRERQMFETAYRTPFGILKMHILPLKVRSVISPGTGKIDLEYVITIGEDSATNRLNIQYTVRS